MDEHGSTGRLGAHNTLSACARGVIEERGLTGGVKALTTLQVKSIDLVLQEHTTHLNSSVIEFSNLFHNGAQAGETRTPFIISNDARSRLNNHSLRHSQRSTAVRFCQ